ncbi:hypothetical protein SAMN04488123_103311 [Natribacillus halophilus]|uniref:Uncharacterized protein n=1 Tax=Natribacillus halophilus TaxID=549003 RepID=A0A1G8LWB5_9BACI|nr:hypothetical protein SAMN04488123_103311 [Natribacillus halophilus]
MLLYLKGRVSHSERDQNRVVIPQKQGISLREGPEARCYTPKAGHLTPRGTKKHVVILRTTGIEPIREGDVISLGLVLERRFLFPLKIVLL